MAILYPTCIPHAAWLPRPHSDPVDGLLGLAAIRYYRFDRDVRVDRFRLCPTALRFQPTAYTRPEHLTLARYVDGHGWAILADVHLPVIAPDAWHEIALDGVVTDHLRVVCDREHPAEECHGDFAHAPWNVPFRILEQVEFLGEPLVDSFREPPVEPMLRVATLAPEAPTGMTCTLTPHEVRFRSPAFHVAFSLLRPLITYLAWDVSGAGLVDRSLVCLDSRLARRFRYQWPADLACGPWFSGLQEEGSAPYWGGEVSVEGNRVRYHEVRVIDGLTLDVEFAVHETGMDVHLQQRAERDLSALEYEAWRFYWKAEEAITGTLAIPVRGTGRTGRVGLPALWNAPGHGALHVQHTAGDPVQLQVDSVRDQHFGMSGIMLGIEHDALGFVTIRKGCCQASLSLRTHELLPRLHDGVTADRLSPGLRRNWPTAFTFRPELGGFSNNCMSVITLMTIHAVVDSCAMTPVASGLPSPLEMARYTIRLAMQGGPGYGEIRDMYMDTDPTLLCAAGRIHQAEPDARWLTEMSPWIKSAARRILDQCDDSGLYLCRRLSGNAGSGCWSSNACDVVSFGHYDAYSNAYAYRALRNAAALMLDHGDEECARACCAAADAIKAAFLSCFFNPATGWLAGWRSRDGQLHDYAFTCINNMAICYGLVEGDDARQMLERLEARREEIGYRDFHYGLPLNLMSICRDDVPVAQQGRRRDGLDMYGIYCNGSAMTYWLEYYIGALDLCGMHAAADRVCADLEESLADNRIVGGIFSGTEMFTWSGAPCGYEGVLQGQFRMMLAIAQHRGWTPRFTPEWWAGPGAAPDA